MILAFYGNCFLFKVGFYYLRITEYNIYIRNIFCIPACFQKNASTIEPRSEYQ